MKLNNIYKTYRAIPIDNLGLPGLFNLECSFLGNKEQDAIDQYLSDIFYIDEMRIDIQIFIN